MRNRRINISIDEFDYQMIRLFSFQQGVSMSTFILDNMIAPFRNSLKAAIDDPELDLLKKMLDVELEKAKRLEEDLENAN